MNVADTLDVSMKLAGALALMLSGVSAFQAARHFGRIGRAQGKARQFERNDTIGYLIASVIGAAATYYFYAHAFKVAAWALGVCCLLWLIYFNLVAKPRLRARLAEERRINEESRCSQT